MDCAVAVAALTIDTEPSPVVVADPSLDPEPSPDASLVADASLGAVVVAVAEPSLDADALPAVAPSLDPEPLPEAPLVEDASLGFGRRGGCDCGCETTAGRGRVAGG